jgi:thioredoxin 2
MRPDMPAQVITCPSCGRKNRVPAAANGTPSCGNCHKPLPWIVDAGDDDFAEVAERSSVPALVDLWAPWCGPCRMVAPEIQKVASRQAGRLLVVKVNTDAVEGVGDRLGIRSIPTMAVFKNGREVVRTAGARPASDIEAFVDSALR